MNWTTLKRHPFNVVPDQNDKDASELKISLETKGYDAKYPIWVYQGPEDSEMMVIDGMQRLTACKELNIQPLVREFIGTEVEAADFILKSIRRRDLTAGQKASVVLDLTMLVERLVIEAKERQEELGRLHGDPSDDIVLRGTTSDLLSGKAGVGSTTMKEMQTVKRYSPELYDHVRQGKMSANAAFRQVKDQQSSKEQRIKINAKTIIQRRLNEAVRLQAPEFLKMVVEDLMTKGETNIKFKIVIDDQ